MGKEEDLIVNFAREIYLDIEIVELLHIFEFRYVPCGWEAG